MQVEIVLLLDGRQEQTIDASAAAARMQKTYCTAFYVDPARAPGGHAGHAGHAFASALQAAKMQRIYRTAFSVGPNRVLGALSTIVMLCQPAEQT